MSVPVATRSKAYVCGRSPAEIVGSNRIGGHGSLSVVSVLYCQIEDSATSWSLVQRSPTDCDASLCVTKKPQEWGGHGPRWAVVPQGEKIILGEVQIMNSLVRSQQVSFEFLIDIKSFRSHYGPGVDSASNRNEYHEDFLEVKAAGV